MKRRDILKLFGLLPFIPAIAKAEKVLPEAKGLYDSNGNFVPITPKHDFNFNTDDFTVEFWVAKDTVSDFKHVALVRKEDTLTTYVEGRVFNTEKIYHSLAKIKDPVTGFEFSYNKGTFYMDFGNNSGLLNELKVYDSNYTIGQTNRNIV